MAPQNAPRYVVLSEPGAGTAETIYTDNYGGRWRYSGVDPSPSDSTTGKTVGTLYPNGTIETRRV